MKEKLLTLLTVAALSTTMTGCAATAQAPANSTARSNFLGYGVVEDIATVQGADRNNIAGTIIGGVVGGLIGTQFGSGTGRAAATAAGAVGGAVAGNQVEKHVRKPDNEYRIRVRMDNGTIHTVRMEDRPDVRVGEHVTVYSNAVVP